MSLIPSFAVGNISVNISVTEAPRSAELCVFGTTVSFTKITEDYFIL